MGKDKVRDEAERAGISAVDAIYTILETQARLETLLLGIDTRLKVLELKTMERPKVVAPVVSVPSISLEDDSDDEEMDDEETEKLILEAIRPKSEDKKPLPLPPQVKVDAPMIRPQKVEMFPDMPEASVEDNLKTKVYGKLKDKSGEPLPAVNVKILDVNSKLVKSTRTSTRGDWMAFVDAGEYIAEFTKAGMKPFFKPITIAPGQKKIEVG